MIRYENCINLIAMARTVLENQGEGDHYIEAGTVNIVKNEYPVILETAKIFWGDDFSDILSDEEEDRANTALTNIITNAVNGVNTAEAYADDTIVLIMTVAMMIDRAEYK